MSPTGGPFSTNVMTELGAKRNFFPFTVLIRPFFLYSLVLGNLAFDPFIRRKISAVVPAVFSSPVVTVTLYTPCGCRLVDNPKLLM